MSCIDVIGGAAAGGSRRGHRRHALARRVVLSATTAAGRDEADQDRDADRHAHQFHLSSPMHASANDGVH